MGWWESPKERKKEMNVNDVDDFKEIEVKDILPAIEKRQLELMEKYKDIEGLPDWPMEIDAKDTQVWIKDFLWRTTEELCESREAQILGHETHKIEELIDAVHFLTECFILVGMKPSITLELMYDNFKRGGKGISGYEKNMGECIYFLGMVGNTLKNKKWKQTNILTDKAKFFQYLDTAYYHLLCTIFSCGCTPHDLYNFYFKKSEVNKFRQRSNY